MGYQRPVKLPNRLKSKYWNKQSFLATQRGYIKLKQNASITINSLVSKINTQLQKFLQIVGEVTSARICLDPKSMHQHKPFDLGIHWSKKS